MAIMRLILCACGLSVFVPVGTAQDNAGSKVYKQTIPSVVWIHSTRDRGYSTGSGSLIDVKKKLVLTNYHVVEDNPRAKVYFPDFRNEKPIAEKSHYTDRAGRLAISGRVIAIEKSVDLALIQLDRIPDDAKAIPLSKSVAEPGQSVHSIGNTGKSDALWGYVPGKVRQVYKHQWSAQLGSNRVLRCRGEVVETDSATNPGDSGGPLLNDQGELIGVTHGGATNAQLLSTFISVSEVKKLLQKEGVGGAKPSNPEPDKPARQKALTLHDGGKFWTADTTKKLQTGIDELFTKHKLDLLVETYPSAPNEDLVRVQKMTAADRTAYMRSWVTRRGKAESVRGVVIIICSDPKSLYVAISPDEKKRFPEEFATKLAKVLTDGLKDQKADQAILEVLRLTTQSLKSD